ncbi:pentapeptide repeat-containing protein [Trichodesmium erythraeum 21-75]|nr:pentapeptide repeat-containing protein [Trichodesmium erythraeum 21-75]
MSTQKLPVNFKYKLDHDSTKMVPSKQEKQNFIENLATGFYNLLGIETLNNEQLHLALKEGRKDFRRTRLIKPNLFKAKLDGINFTGVNLNKVNLSEASLMNTQLHKTKMLGANLDSANLKGANLSRANLKDAQLSWADLRNTNLSNTLLYNANLTGADLDRSSIMSAKRLFTKFDHARLPSGVSLVRYFWFFIKLSA